MMTVSLPVLTVANNLNYFWRIEMARGLACRYCNFPMRVVSTNMQPQGTWVVYECQNATCKGGSWSEKVFEGKN